MLKKVQQFFDDFLTPNSEPNRSKEEIIHLTTAALLIELSKADFERDPSEQAAIVTALKTSFGLTDQQLAPVLELAEQEVKDSTSLYQFTRLVNDNYSVDDKKTLLRMLWVVAYADGNIDKYEEHLIRKIAELLYLDHQDFIKQKIAVRDSLEK